MTMLPELLTECLAVPNHEGQGLAYSLLERNGYYPTQGKGWTFAQGELPICLIAHTDTVHDKPPTMVYHDTVKRVIWAPSGLGADDRAGVYAIAELLAQGYRPSVLLTDLEEVGGKGATQAALDMDAPPGCRLLVQLDRRGADDAVYYELDNPSLERWVAKHGFATAIGSFSDISILAPAWRLGAVNLSVGYYREHTAGEHLRLDELEATIERVGYMLRHPPRRKFAYREVARKERSWRSLDSLLRDYPSPTYYPQTELWDNPLDEDDMSQGER